MVWMMGIKTEKENSVDNWLYYIDILQRNKTKQ